MNTPSVSWSGRASPIRLHTLDQFWQLVVAIDPAPTLLGALDQLEDHGERGLVRQTAF